MNDRVRETIGGKRGDQAAFAARLGISPAYLSQLLSGRRKPSARLARRISRETGVPLEDLLFNEVA